MNVARTLVAGASSVGGNPSNSMKMVLIVRADLGLGRGKIASQCAHAAVMCVMEASRVCETKLNLWLCEGQPKIVLKAESKKELEFFARKAREKNVVAEVVMDAGRTQVQSGTETVLGLGPDSAEVIDSLVGHLKLL
ncbi:uncharacterized protein LOC129747958 [Uranotaenia lowii]|uniref:uncharacterized protein LOC129747958 n=1 Tax=Uranotaenia lowii TaxID=190385 RepID=UPI002479E317|nr:uncharacterized protein LOC129747958 [Uranotaenia lowii]